MGSYNDGAAALFEKLQAAAEASLPFQDHPRGGKVAVVPDGYELLHMEAAAPDYIRALPRFDIAESFVDYVNDFKSPSTRIFASMANRQFTAVLDYHDKNGASGKMAHIATFGLKYSPAFSAWGRNNGGWMLQKDFAEFLEEQQESILAPDAATVLELVENFSETRKVTFQSRIRRQNGQFMLAYQDMDDNSTGAQKLPERLRLAMPVYEGEGPFQFDAFVRTQVKDGALFIKVQLHKLAEVERSAFDAICESVAASTQIKIAHGSWRS